MWCGLCSRLKRDFLPFSAAAGRHPLTLEVEKGAALGPCSCRTSLAADRKHTRNERCPYGCAALRTTPVHRSKLLLYLARSQDMKLRH